MAGPQRLNAGRQALLEALKDAGVQFVVIGGVAIASHGEEYRTQDIDLIPERSPENLQRLADMLNRWGCRLVIDPQDRSQDVPLPAGYFTARNLGQQDVWNLATPYGLLDLPFTPAGFPDGYTQLVGRARTIQVAETTVEAPVAALIDVEHSKRTANRPKDLEYLNTVGRREAPRAPDPQHDQLRRLHQAAFPDPPARTSPESQSSPAHHPSRSQSQAQYREGYRHSR